MKNSAGLPDPKIRSSQRADLVRPTKVAGGNSGSDISSRGRGCRLSVASKVACGLGQTLTLEEWKKMDEAADKEPEE